ncbi:hypothetical protein [Chengkuizengella marina]|uniref:Uncharacterized protein n=1 Tax=Chengkuizengella marina TaxID=2507566 RepID=A0A6N9Q2V3_9BACL|nr:hypothetical protein [Chengkuizengella marina]NBI29111.1 hypothetical protein [Chengkuizengella marina]
METFLKQQMIDEWESWEFLIREDLERLEYRIQSVYKSMAVSRVDSTNREKLVLQKLKELIFEVSEKNELRGVS